MFLRRKRAAEKVGEINAIRILRNRIRAVDPDRACRHTERELRRQRPRLTCGAPGIVLVVIHTRNLEVIGSDATFKFARIFEWASLGAIVVRGHVKNALAPLE